MQYQHTQIGYVMILITVLVTGFIGVQVVQFEIDYGVIVFLIAVFSIMLSFCWMQITIDGSSMYIKFGYGLFRKTIDLQNVESVQVARHKWYNGWGFRFWLYPPTWIFNVSGLDVVDIKMKKGVNYRIGTDEPQQLEKAIMAVHGNYSNSVY